ncbi:hypothetical protein [Amycolatopsis samaneae]|uniref:Uncharacterized protein n=1 Tax=Amycolatopsis samaneae TaxID=664691 RepID=A0ABW5GXB2_9PSEU
MNTLSQLSGGEMLEVVDASLEENPDITATTYPGRDGTCAVWSEGLRHPRRSGVAQTTRRDSVAFTPGVFAGTDGRRHR